MNISREFHAKEKSRSYHILTPLRKELMQKLEGEFCEKCNYNTFGALLFTYREHNSEKNDTLNITKYQYYLNNAEQAKKDLEILCYNCHRIKMNKSSRSRNIQYQKYIKNYDIRHRKKIMTLLNQHNCVNCGETDWKVLEIDHIKGIGNRLFKVFKSKRKEWLYFINNSQNIRQELQILCRNCRKLKQFDVLQESITVCC